MNGDHMTVQAGMTAAVIILTGITALLTEIVRAVLVRMTTAKVVVITADHLITTVTTTVAPAPPVRPMLLRKEALSNAAA